MLGGDDSILQALGVESKRVMRNKTCGGLNGGLIRTHKSRCRVEEKVSLSL